MLADPMAFTLILTGFIFVAAAWISGRFPPRKINMLYGYRTKRSMSSPEQWALAQDISRKAMYRAGLAMMILGVALVPMDGMKHVVLHLVVITIALAGACWWIIHTTEEALKARERDGSDRP